MGDKTDPENLQGFHQSQQVEWVGQGAGIQYSHILQMDKTQNEDKF